MRVDRFVNVSSDELVRLGNQISWIKVLAVDNRGKRACVDLRLRNQSILVPVATHAVASILNWGHSLFLWFDRTVVLDPFNFEVDMSLIT